MEYPLISEYREAILSAEDNFNELSSLRPVLDSHGDPVMSSGNFAVVFKMRDENDGKLYAVKCFIKDQEGREEGYWKIADELETVSSSYILPLRYLENELFVDTAQCDMEEFPVVVMEWVEGETLDAYLNRNLNDKYELEMLSYQFNRMAAWLLAQPFAHGDLKPDNILVRKDGSLVLVDYDGMFVPSMKGETAREIGSPDYQHPARTNADFDEHIDDFSIAVIALSLEAIALNPELKSNGISSDTLLLSEKDYRDPEGSILLRDILRLSSDSVIQTLLGIFYISLAKKSLDTLSFRLFMTDKPKMQKILESTIHHQNEMVDTSYTDKDIETGVEDEFGVVYSHDGKRLLNCKRNLSEYSIKYGTQIICNGSFFGKSLLKSISIPESVIAIGDIAFNRCCSLQNISMPDSVTEIGGGAFSNCPNLSLDISLNSPFRLINGLLIDKYNRVCCCLNHSQSITIPKYVTAICYHAFEGCDTLKNISIPHSVTDIGKGAFFGCKSLQNLSIPDSVTSIGDGAFSNCPQLSLDMPASSSFRLIDGLLIDKNMRLVSCLNHSTIISIPESITAIGNHAFYGCNNLLNILIPTSVTDIGKSAFLECKLLQDVSIPNSVTKIADCTFYKCESLQNISIPDSITTLGAHAFSKCKSLTDVSIPNSVTCIKDYAFSECTSLQNISIPDSVTTLGAHAFSKCKSLTDVSIPNSITNIKDYTFFKCASLQRISLPNSITVIGDKTFYGCDTLKNISIPHSVTDIGKGAFFGCKSLQNVSIPNSVTEISDYTFYGCNSIQSICIPDSVTILGAHSFSKCKSLKTISLSNSVISIGRYAFKGCESLQSVTLPNSITIIEYEVFRGCKSLQSVSIPIFVTIIRSGAFYGCKSLKKVYIPKSVTNIGSYAFYECSLLQFVSISKSETAIGEDAFPENCQILQK